MEVMKDDNKRSTNLDVNHKPNGEFAKGNKANVNGVGGFQDRPNDRSNGRWNKDESISYQYNKLLRMSPEQFDEFTPVTMAQKIALKRLVNATADEGLNDTKEITDRTEGKAPQFIGVGGESEYKKALVEFINISDDINTSDN